MGGGRDIYSNIPQCAFIAVKGGRDGYNSINESAFMLIAVSYGLHLLNNNKTQCTVVALDG